jgi:hypothetical protein
LHCLDCDSRTLPEQPLIHGFTWKTAFYRGALLRIAGRLHEQRTAQQQSASAAGAGAGTDASVTALVLRTDEENAEYVRRRFGELRQGRARRAGFDEAAYRRGHERGVDVSLAPDHALRSKVASALPGTTPRRGAASRPRREDR